ncbi:MAG: Ornithine cyclodeaminase [Chlamydiales bacterium]|nr:Ornithine cyclodeaminase [Chlamydiales bacterium]
MVLTLSVEEIRFLVHKNGFNKTVHELMSEICSDFSRWHDFHKTPRPGINMSHGVFELMPVADTQYYTFKYVNCHPENPKSNKRTVSAIGQIADVETGYPLMISEMTVLTAIRTAAVSAIATDLMARKNSRALALIGTGAQSDFQVRAMQLIREIKTVYYYDTDPQAMQRFAHNLKDSGLTLIPCKNVQQAVADVDIVITCTACKQHVDVVKFDWIKPGTHITGLGGDCVGKTELEKSIIENSRVVVEFFPQSYFEGEIQRFDEKRAKELVHAELWEVITNQKTGRQTEDEITVFDSVGFALEDFSTLKYFYELAQKHQISTILPMLPSIKDPKDLISVLEKTIAKHE